jgi:hypothetical protein
MRTPFLIMSIALGLALLVAAALGTGYATLRSEVKTRQARTAHFCRQVSGEMLLHGEALLMSSPAEDSRERLMSPERGMTGRALSNGYYYCLIAAGAEPAQANEWALQLSLKIDSSAVETALQALNEAIERLAHHGY